MPVLSLWRFMTRYSLALKKKKKNEKSKHQKEGILAQSMLKTHKKLSVFFEWIHAFQSWQIASQNNEFKGIISCPPSLFLEQHWKCE